MKYHPGPSPDRVENPITYSEGTVTSVLFHLGYHLIVDGDQEFDIKTLQGFLNNAALALSRWL
jgi:hypothetical protein